MRVYGQFWRVAFGGGGGGREGGLRGRLCKLEGVKKRRELNENIKMGNKRNEKKN